MKRILLFSLLCFFVKAHAVDWVKIGENKNKDSFYVDVENIKKNNSFVYYWNLINLLDQTKIGAHSYISKYKVDCVHEQQIWLSNTFYNQPMAKGKIITNSIPVWNHYGSTLNEIRYLAPGSIEDRIMKFVCDLTK